MQLNRRIDTVPINPALALKQKESGDASFQRGLQF